MEFLRSKGKDNNFPGHDKHLIILCPGDLVASLLYLQRDNIYLLALKRCYGTVDNGTIEGGDSVYSATI